MSFFDDSHVTEVGLQGSLGPTVGFGEMVSQSFQQQFRVDSARALDEELRNRWIESLRGLSTAGSGQFNEPINPQTYRAFAGYTRGQPIEGFGTGVEGSGYGARFVDIDPIDHPDIQAMLRANEAIKKLNDPKIKSFEQILEEVSQMQHEVEGETASMYERSGTGGWLASLLGSVAGSFTTRDPLNIVTAPIGAGRTVATRIATDMGVAALVTGYSEVAEVAPARQIAGLPERNPLFNIAAATIGAGVIRGGIEGIGYGLGRLRGEDIDFDLRDSQLAQMFDAVNTPSARAGAKALDDVQFIERNNPYGEGQAAQARFIEELRQVQRVMGGEPMTAVARMLPPLPFDYIKKAADFEIVREQAPQVYAKMEAARVRVTELQEGKMSFERVSASNLKEDVNVIKFKRGDIEGDLTWRNGETEAGINIYGGGPNTSNAADLRVGLADIKAAFPELESIRGIRMSGARKETPQQVRVSLDRAPLSKERQAANAEYEAAYREVEAEATRLREQQVRVEAEQQRQAVGIFADATVGRPFNWSALQYDSVQARVDAINAFNDTLDEATVARFVRETVGEGEEAVEREVWRTEGGIDIGLKQPVDPEFRISTDDGDITVEAAMRDLQDDADLDDAMRTCLL